MILFVLRSSRKEFFAYFCKKSRPWKIRKKTMKNSCVSH